MRILGLACTAIVVLLMWSPLQLKGDLLDDIGYTELAQRLGPSLPAGTTQVISQVEASVSSTQLIYRPNPGRAPVDDIIFVAESGDGDGTSWHADTVGKYIYGELSPAQGIPEVHAYYADDWIFGGFLQTGENDPLAPPLPGVGRVHNHSWVARIVNPDPATLDELNEILRRLDWAAAQPSTGFLPVVGADNGSSRPLPYLLTQGYHSLTVGLTNGNHSYGTTLTEGTGRIKPEIVAPLTLTSYATGLVSGAAALLFDAGAGMASSASITPLVVKSVLLAGATKEEISGWNRSESQPLDDRHGAGELNLNLSHLILEAGPHPKRLTTETVPASGWAVDTLAATDNHAYWIPVPEGWVLDDLSVVLCWEREVTMEDGLPITYMISDLNLDLRKTIAPGSSTRVDQSIATVGNVEHCWIGDALAPGEYFIEAVNVSGGNTPYSLAWRGVLRGPVTYEEWWLSQTDTHGLSEPEKDYALDGEMDGQNHLLEYVTGGRALHFDPSPIWVSPDNPRDVFVVVRNNLTDATLAVGIADTPAGPFDFSGIHLAIVDTELIEGDRSRIHYEVLPSFPGNKIFYQAQASTIE